ncbi:hypothetical protein D051_5410 [Vibrio parahaemolyticus VPCR-2010]|nr:hypothetical protein Vp2S01_A0934 [Vibrio parahaemolyticus]EFO46518.1 conserved hypothetical protein [Vibrio parahaemolyticus AQ4037]EFO51854.1 conserved hypothetical protein [Vibrio parahaemolyticus K5030]EQM04673.1 hypothetical protein D036_2178 [Vibrio parahaemolyticus VP232]EQM11700.1 hypothetical protein D024_5043 [Vibrio parahaemolyticus 3259]EQM51733.1 hypothetical protein D051_5410 [Vibrio parahaemolyticus VPCR-2010]ETS23805.1 hypothetical protein D033_0690 [Vibrio parahaemolyticus
MDEKFFVWNPQAAHVNFSPFDEIKYSSHWQIGQFRFSLSFVSL